MSRREVLPSSASSSGPGLLRAAQPARSIQCRDWLSVGLREIALSNEHCLIVLERSAT